MSGTYLKHILKIIHSIALVVFDHWKLLSLSIYHQKCFVSLINPFPYIEGFWSLCNRWFFENILTTGENAQTCNSSLGHNVFNFLSFSIMEQQAG